MQCHGVSLLVTGVATQQNKPPWESHQKTDLANGRIGEKAKFIVFFLSCQYSHNKVSLVLKDHFLYFSCCNTNWNSTTEKKQHLLIHFVEERDKSYTNGIRKSRAFPETSRIKVCTRKQCYSSTKSFVIVCRPGDIFFRHSWSYLPSLFTPIILPQ